MSKQTLKDPVITVNGQDISNFCHEVHIEYVRPEVDVTGYQAAAQETIMGIPDATITLVVFQDFSAGAIDALLWPLASTDTPFPVTVKPHNLAPSPTNPLYSMQALLPGYTPIDSGAPGEALDATVTFRNATQAGLTRATS